MTCSLSNFFINVCSWHKTDIHTHIYPPTATLADSPAKSSTPSGNLSI